MFYKGLSTVCMQHRAVGTRGALVGYFAQFSNEPPQVYYPSNLDPTREFLGKGNERTTISGRHKPVRLCLCGCVWERVDVSIPCSTYACEHSRDETSIWMIANGHWSYRVENTTHSLKRTASKCPQVSLQRWWNHKVVNRHELRLS